MPRRPSASTRTDPFVVYVRFPSGGNEYAYWCDLPNVTVGSLLVINNARVLVHRIASSDDRATNWVPNSIKEIDMSRRRSIAARLAELEKQEACITRWSKLKSPEAKRLVRELKELTR